jgi:hypothetical protein
MKLLLAAGFLVLLLSGCEKKEENTTAFTAGNLNNNRSYSLNYKDSIPDVVTTGLYNFEWMSTQITIDKFNDLQVRVGHTWGITRGELFQKAFRIGNSSSDFEFAVNAKDTVVGQNDTLTFVRIYDYSELISENQRWLKRDSDHLFYLSLFYKKDLNEYVINQNLTDKYIGIRKLINGKMMYGWIKIEIRDNDVLVLKESCFDD